MTCGWPWAPTSTAKLTIAIAQSVLHSSLPSSSEGGEDVSALEAVLAGRGERLVTRHDSRLGNDTAEYTTEVEPCPWSPDDATVVGWSLRASGIVFATAPKNRRFRSWNRVVLGGRMPPETLANRVTILEHKMQRLEGLPDRVASLEVQILQFRAEVRAGIFCRARGRSRRDTRRRRGNPPSDARAARRSHRPLRAPGRTPERPETFPGIPQPHKQVTPPTKTLTVGGREPGLTPVPFPLRFRRGAYSERGRTRPPDGWRTPRRSGVSNPGPASRRRTTRR